MYYSKANFKDHNLTEDNLSQLKIEGAHRKINYDLCTAIDMIKFGIVLDKLVVVGMHPQLRELYYAQAGSLLALLRSENNRLFGE